MCHIVIKDEEEFQDARFDVHVEDLHNMHSAFLQDPEVSVLICAHKKKPNCVHDRCQRVVEGAETSCDPWR